MLSGMRQVGKSTLFSHLKESERKHINLDDFDFLDLAENAPSAFFRQNLDFFEINVEKISNFR